MADASIIDIGGTQWNVKDAEARNKIATIEDFLTTKVMPDIKITLNNGYSAITKHIMYIQRYGKLYMGLLYIDDLAGKGIGTNNTTEFGKVNISLNTNTFAVGIEYLSSSPVRVAVSETGALVFYESKGVTSGNNRLRIPITWIEA